MAKTNQHDLIFTENFYQSMNNEYINDVQFVSEKIYILIGNVIKKFKIFKITKFTFIGRAILLATKSTLTDLI